MIVVCDVAHVGRLASASWHSTCNVLGDSPNEEIEFGRWECLRVSTTSPILRPTH